MVQTSSSQLLLLNVEDILGYAQIQNGRFSKNVKPFNIKRAVNDIMDIQQYQANAKEIKLEADFYNFPPKESVIDEYRKNDVIPVRDQNHIVCSEEKRIK